MLFSESRYDFQRCLWSDIWDLIKAVANPKGLGAHHPKYRTTVCFGGLLIRISAFRKKHDRLMTRLRTVSELDPFRFEAIF
jgi:hypothetical protein